MENNFNIENFDQIDNAIIDFTASWCGPCKILNPILDEINSDTNIKVFKFDIDEHQELAIKYEIRSIPTLLIFKNGVLINRLIGIKNKQEILKTFE